MEYQGRKLAHPRISPATLSVQNPVAYSERFVKFMQRITKTPEEIAQGVDLDEDAKAAHRTIH